MKLFFEKNAFYGNTASNFGVDHRLMLLAATLLSTPLLAN